MYTIYIYIYIYIYIFIIILCKHFERGDYYCMDEEQRKLTSSSKCFIPSQFSIILIKSSANT